MSYVPMTPVIPSDKASKMYEYSLPFTGVRLSEDLSENAVISNYDIGACSLKSRKPLIRLTADNESMSQLHGYSKQSFGERCFLHIGNNLYSFGEGDTEYSVVYSQMPDKKSLFCHFMSKLYIYCDKRIFCLDENFVLSECEPYAPVLYENINPYGINITKKDVAINLISTRICVKYSTTSTKTYSFPLYADLSRPVKVEVNGVFLEENDYTLAEKSLTITKKSLTSDDRDLNLYFYVQNPEDIGFDEGIYNCECVTSFGSSAGGGSRLFFTGNAGKKGSYYKSELLDPLNVPSDSEEIIGDGCENVTALIKMYGALIILCENSIYRMDYRLGDDGAYFTCKQISHGRGCDIPDSVQLIDNRVVFANTKEGLFIVDSTDEAGEHNIKPIGSNILKGQNMGFLDMPIEERRKAKSADFDRKYCLFVGDIAYIWDYDKSNYSDSGNYSKSAQRLIWYIYDGLVGGIVFNMGMSICILAENSYAFYGFSSIEDDINFNCELVSEKIDFGQKTNYKFVDKISFFMSKSENSNAVLSVFADGEKYYEVNLTQTCGSTHKVDIILPKKRLYNFGIRLACDGRICIENISLKYKILSK